MYIYIYLYTYYIHIHIAHAQRLIRQTKRVRITAAGAKELLPDVESDAPAIVVYDYMTHSYTGKKKTPPMAR